MVLGSCPVVQLQVMRHQISAKTPRTTEEIRNQYSDAQGQHLHDLANALLDKTQEIECKDCTVEDAPNNPMHFGRWKESFILSAAKNVRREADLAVKC